MDSGARPSLLMVSLKVYSTSASSSEPEIPSTGPLEPRPKFRVEQCSGPWKENLQQFFIYVVCLSSCTKSCSTQSQIHSNKHTCICKLWPKIIGERLSESRPTKISFQYLFQINRRPDGIRKAVPKLGCYSNKSLITFGVVAEHGACNY